MTETLTVTVRDHVYNVHFGTDTYHLLQTEYAALLSSADRVAIIVDDTVASLYLQQLKEALMAVRQDIIVKIVPSGERCKTPEVYLECQSFLLQHQFSRSSLLIAFGGGAVGDLTGFVAATFMRGIRYIQCPTTILAHDSAVGGKTAINMPEGKNMVGSFHQPDAVLFSTSLFTSLPSQEVRSGFAELIKHALISNKEWTNDLLIETNLAELNFEWLAHELKKGTEVKANIVMEDEFEHGARKFLNFGHTFGHAVEAVEGFGGISHGECVVIGMIYALIVSETEGQIDSSFTNQFITFAKNNDYPLDAIDKHPFETFFSYMMKDKKAAFGKLNFVILQEIGKPFVTELNELQCQAAFEQMRMRVKEE